MNRLIPLSNYVLEQLSKVNNGEIGNLNFRRNLEHYTHFLHQNLKDSYEINGVSAHPLNRFIPCDLDGNILEEPKINDVSFNIVHGLNSDLEYQKSKDRVLFEGFYINTPNKENDDWIPSICYENILHVFWKYEYSDEWSLSKGLFTIQDLCKYNIPITETALKNYKHD